jgi:ADP-ribosylglycohydrolase
VETATPRHLTASENAPLDAALERIAATAGTSILALESVPAAIATFKATNGDPLTAVRAAAGLGGDTDTIASIAGALAGALSGPASLPADWIAAVEEASGVDLAALAAALRRAPRPAPGTR